MRISRKEKREKAGNSDGKVVNFRLARDTNDSFLAVRTLGYPNLNLTVF